MFAYKVDLRAKDLATITLFKFDYQHALSFELPHVVDTQQSDLPKSLYQTT